MERILLYLFTTQMNYMSPLPFYSFCSKYFFLQSFKSFQETGDRLWGIVVQVYTTLHFLLASHLLKYFMCFIAAIGWWVVGSKELNLILCENWIRKVVIQIKRGISRTELYLSFGIFFTFMGFNRKGEDVTKPIINHSIFYSSASEH